jgi:hypothetical protein
MLLLLMYFDIGARSTLEKVRIAYGLYAHGLPQLTLSHLQCIQQKQVQLLARLLSSLGLLEMKRHSIL